MIPVSRPVVGLEEIQAVTEVLLSGNYSTGKITSEFEKEWASYIGTKYAISCSSGTAALHMVYQYFGLTHGKKFVTAPMGFFSTVSAGLVLGAKPLFVDVDDRCNFDASKLEKLLNEEEVDLVVPVHLFGHPCEIEDIVSICSKYEIPVVEDCAQAHGAEFKRKKVGSFGSAGCFSFFATKNITTIEGGMITTDNKYLYEFCKMVREHGMSDRNTHEFLGYNYRIRNELETLSTYKRILQMKK